MKQLKYQYDMDIVFSEPIREHRFTVKCIPMDCETQKVENQFTDINPNGFLCRSEDPFGNHIIYGYEKNPHDRFCIHSEGIVSTGLSNGECIKKNEVHYGFLRYNTKLTTPGEHINAISEQCAYQSNRSPFENAKEYMHKLHEIMEYAPGTTTIFTTAEEAAALRKGVCQDYSHIMLSILRKRGIICRYVVGFLEGEGVSHAWIEVLSNGVFYGLDPTNDLVVEDRHIKISNGRDYRDCLINHGIFAGSAAQIQQISAVVKENSI